MRSWSIEIWLLNDRGEEVQANCFEKAVYNLHPSFERPKQSTSAVSFHVQQATDIFQPSRSPLSRSRRRDGESST